MFREFFGVLHPILKQVVLICPFLGHAGLVYKNDLPKDLPLVPPLGVNICVKV